MMGRAVNSKATYEEITDPNCCFEREDCDAWWVHAGATPGSADHNLREAFHQNLVAHFFRFEPHALPLIGFERKNRPRFYKREILIRHAYSRHPFSHLFLQRLPKDAEAPRSTSPAVPH